MRYKSNKLAPGETVIVGALFPTGETVTVEVWDMAAQSTVSLSDNTTDELGTTGFFVWSTANLTTQPTTIKHYLVIFTSSTGAQAAQKVVFGGYPDEVAESSFDGVVHIDTTGSGTAGQNYPIGTANMPSDNITDAKAIADARGIRRYHIRGSITLNATHQNWKFIGDSSALADTVTVGSQDVNNSTFEGITVTGAIGGSGDKKITFINCIADTVTGFNGVMQGGGIRTSIGLVGATRTAQFNGTKWLTTVVNGILNANGIGNVLASDMSGLFTVTNFTSGGVLFLRAESAEITLAASCTSGFYAIGGDGVLVDNSAGGMVELKNELLNKAVHTQLVQDGMDTQGYDAGRAVLLDNLDATISSRASQTSLDTLDDYVDTEVAAIKAKTDNLPADPASEATILAAIPSPADNADAVWDEDLSGHTTPGTAGDTLSGAATPGDVPTADEIAQETENRLIPFMVT